MSETVCSRGCDLVSDSLLSLIYNQSLQRLETNFMYCMWLINFIQIRYVFMLFVKQKLKREF